jgi:nucleoid-associated protein YgaU
MAGKTAFGTAAGAVAGAATAMVVLASGYFVYTGVTSPAELDLPVSEVAIPEAEVAEQDTAAVERPAVQIPEADVTPKDTATIKPPQVGTMPADAIVPISKLPLSDVTDEALVEPEAPVVQSVEADTPNTADTLDAAEPSAPTAPSFDLVRIDQDGFSTIAGRADPEVAVAVLVDGTEIYRTTTTAGGEFVALFEVSPSEQPRELQLLALSGAQSTLSESSIVVTPQTSASAPAEAPQLSEPEMAADAAVEGLNETPSVSEKASAPNAALNAAVAGLEDPQTGTPEETSPIPELSHTILKADDEGVKVLQSGQVNALNIDAITYDPDGSVFASGRAAPDTLVRLYVDNELQAQTRSAANGQWRSELELAAGIYALRADMVSAQGSVEGRAELTFKRENLETLARVAGLTAAQSEEENLTSVTGASEGVAAPDAPAALEDVQDTLAAKSRIASVTVQPGNTLWGIARENYGDGYLFSRVFEENGNQIRDPNLIYPGQVFVLPSE